MTRDLLAKAIADAAHQANVQLKQVEGRQQAPTTPSCGACPSRITWTSSCFKSFSVGISPQAA